MFDPNQQVYPDRAPQIVSIYGVNVRADLAFSDAKGKDNNAQRKTAEKALAGLQSILPRLMGPNEAVLAVGFAFMQLSYFEQMFLGWSAFTMSRAILVVTNRGLLRFRIRNKGFIGWQWDRGVQGIGWGDLAEATPKGGLGRRFLVRYRNGQRECFSRLAGAFYKKLQMLVPVLVNASLGDASAATAATALCPKCLAPQTAGVYRCTQCGQEFCDEKKLLWRTLLIPGGEYFYVRQVAWGVVQAFVEVVILVWAVVLAGVALTSSGDDAVSSGVAAGFIFLVLIFHKWAAYIQCRRLVRGFVASD
jgi:hypothetical protein